MADFEKRLGLYRDFFGKMSEYSELDVECKLLLLFFFSVHAEIPKLGFGKLLRELKKRGTVYDAKRKLYIDLSSRSTLSSHLGHLVEKGILSSEVLEESRRHIKDRRYFLSPLMEEMAKGFLHVKDDRLKVKLVTDAIRNVDDSTVVLFVFRAFGTYGLKALSYALSLDDEDHSQFARRAVYYVLDEVLRCVRKAILESKRKEEVQKEAENFSTMLGLDVWPHPEEDK